MRCWVKSRNERNPRPQLPSLSWALCGDRRRKPEEDGDDVKSSRPPCPGRHTCYNGRHSAPRPREGKPIAKACPSSDRGLQFDPVKPELLVIADQVNTFPGLVHTARHTMRAGKARKRLPNPKGRAASKAGPVIGVKSKQGIPSRTRGWITSFLRRKHDEVRIFPLGFEGATSRRARRARSLKTECHCSF